MGRNTSIYSIYDKGLLFTHCWDTPSQAVFVRDVVFNLAEFFGWWVIAIKKQQQFDIDNFCENAKQVSHDYAIGDIVYVDVTGL